MGLAVSLVARICSCLCDARAQAQVSDAELALGRAQRKLLKATEAAMAAAEEPAEPDNVESTVELTLELPLRSSGGLGMNTSGNTRGKGIVFRGYSEGSRLSQMDVLFDGCRIVAVFLQTSVGSRKWPDERIELGGLSYPVALKVLGLHINTDLVEMRKEFISNGVTLSVVLVVAAPNTLSAPVEPEQESLMPLEQVQAEASLIMLRSRSLLKKQAEFEEAVSRINAPELLRFSNSESCVKIELAGDYYSIYGTGANFSSFVKYERVKGAKKDNSNSYNGSWLEGGLVFSGFSTPDCELARLGVLEEGCHLVGYEVFVSNDCRFFKSIRSFKEERDVKRILGNGYLVFRNVAKAQVIEVVSA